MKCKSLIIFALLISLTGCDLFFPGNPAPKLCKEENRVLSEAELAHAVLDFYYDDPLQKIPVDVPEGRITSHYQGPSLPFTHFANFIDAHIRNNNGANRRSIIADYHKQFPDCCFVKYPSNIIVDPSFDWASVEGYEGNDKTGELKKAYRAYDVFIFPDTAPDAGLTVQKQYFVKRMMAQRQKKPVYLPHKWPIIVRGLSACGIVGVKDLAIKTTIYKIEKGEK